MIDPPTEHRVLAGPEKVRGEYRWLVELGGGDRGLLAQQLPELAADESLRRRFVYESERRAGLELPGLAPLLAVGPEPDPRDPSAAPPWRLRAEPEGQTLAELAGARAPMPVDEAVELVARLAELVHAAHQAGLVIRDLEPRNVVVSSGGTIHLTDIGFARVDILSTRTASSLMLESSPYASPEHLRSTTIDHRSDIYALGAILWHLLLGSVPFDSGPALFRRSDDLPDPRSARPEISAELADLMLACLDDQPERRPDSARDVAEFLRGRGFARQTALALVTCQSCSQPLRPGLRLCLSCGREAVQFVHADADAERFDVLLLKAKEDLEFDTKLRQFFELLAEEPPAELNFLIGDQRMYSKEERSRLKKLPATLFSDLSKDTADRLAKRLTDEGFKVAVKAMDRNERTRRRAGKWAVGSLLAGIGGGVLIATGSAPAIAAGAIALAFSVPIGIINLIRRSKTAKPIPPPLAGLRKQPAALPASDPLVARVSTLLQAGPADDVRAQLSETALLIQRLCDHQAALEDTTDLERIAEPVVPLVELVEKHALAIGRCDAALAELDEGVLVRAIAAAEARGESRTELLEGLDRLRGLEDQRAHHMQRLLEAASLTRRVVELGLAIGDEASEHEREYRMALARLDAEL